MNNLFCRQLTINVNTNSEKMGVKFILSLNYPGLRRVQVIDY